MKIFTSLLKRHSLVALRGTGCAVLLASAACSGNPADGQWVGDDVTRNDFEAVAGWGGADRSTLTRDHAHSGRYAVLVDSGHENGLMFDLPLYEASVHSLTAVEVEAWVYLPSDKADARLQLELVADGPEPRAVLHQEEMPLLPQVSDFKKWTLVHQLFQLPQGQPGNAHLRLYLKRGNSTEPVYLDDIRVKAREW
jgi:non-ribosomal peptide synthetase component F